MPAAKLVILILLAAKVLAVVFNITFPLLSIITTAACLFAGKPVIVYRSSPLETGLAFPK